MLRLNTLCKHSKYAPCEFNWTSLHASWKQDWTWRENLNNVRQFKQRQLYSQKINVASDLSIFLILRVAVVETNHGQNNDDQKLIELCSYQDSEAWCWRYLFRIFQILTVVDSGFLKNHKKGRRLYEAGHRRTQSQCRYKPCLRWNCFIVWLRCYDCNKSTKRTMNYLTISRPTEATIGTLKGILAKLMWPCITF